MSWTHANLETQGYCLTGDEARALRVGLRFPTALCLALVVTGLALESALMIALLVPIGAVAGWTSRHPFDLHLEPRPATPRAGARAAAEPDRRRHAFKLATVWLAAVAVLFATGADDGGARARRRARRRLLARHGDEPVPAHPRTPAWLGTSSAGFGDAERPVSPREEHDHG